MKDFLQLCFRKNPDDRPSALDLLDHAWIQRHYHASDTEDDLSDGLISRERLIDTSRPVSLLFPRDFEYHSDVEHRRTSSTQDLPQPSILVNKLQERQEKGRSTALSIARDHYFIKGSFPKGAIRCKACQLPIRRNALVCEGNAR